MVLTVLSFAPRMYLYFPLSSKFDGMKLEAFCIYHKEGIDKRFTEEQKQKLMDHHGKALMIIN
jgi:hypothetical protein